jgi:anaerobic magnesium-protoporphyrin IX monomethyl ester cyclase
MKVALISLDQEIFTVGIRILSSCLREDRHVVKCIFLPDTAITNQRSSKFQFTYSSQLLDELKALCSDVRLIGISLLTNQYLQAAQITIFLKSCNFPAPIIWGGIEPTVEPEECLQFADMVCRGEGEEALREVVQCIEKDEKIDKILNVWTREGDQCKRNSLRPLNQDLDVLPLPDYSCQDHYISEGEHIVPLTREKLFNFRGERYHANAIGLRYPILTSRGCPYACTYCCNSVYEMIYRRQKRLRWRGTEQIIQELKMITKNVAPLDTVFFVDDNFTARSARDLASFCEAYQREIGIPFFCQVSPLTVSEEKLEILLKAGCAKVVMGLETANERVASLYNRSQSHAATSHAITLIEKYRSQMVFPPTYQFIIDNPYETLEEMLETLNLALSLPRPWDNPIYSLMLFPGTPMYEKALHDGLIVDRQSQIYGKNWLDQSQPYLQFWIFLYRANFPRLILKFMLTPWIVKLMTSQFIKNPRGKYIFRWFWRMGG